MQPTIVIAVIILGIKRVKPSALFAKLFDAVPRITAIIRIMYADIFDIYLLYNLLI